VGLLTNFGSLPVRTSFGLLWRILVACLLIGWHFETQARATITFSQVGNDVQATISGNLNLTGLTGDSAVLTGTSRVRGGGAGANVVIGESNVTSPTSLIGISGPQTIGCSKNTIDASSATTDPNGPFGINMSLNRLIVPNGFGSGNAVSASSTWNGSTISSLGLTTGTYVYSWNQGQETLTIIVPSGGASCVAAAAVPTLSEWSRLLLALMTIVIVGWHFHRERRY